MSNKFVNVSAALLLFTMAMTGILSMKGDSATMDELAHIPAGYSYLTQFDYRINPEHPPLAKDFAALPLLFLDLKFPIESSAWTEDVNGQWQLGTQFIYESGNDADQIIFWARIPMILLLLLLGFLIFKFAKELFNKESALLALAFFSFSPSFIAHGRLVTTDIAATLGTVLATYFWFKFLKNRTKKTIILAGAALGIALLLKFSLILLIPFFAVITLAYVFLEKKPFWKYVFSSVLAGLVALFLVITPVYMVHTANYPAERQLSDTKEILQSSPMESFKNLCIWAADKPLVRAPGHYLLGLLMATQRTASGNTGYFLGQVSGTGWWYYFPVVYFLKVPLAFHILSLLALIFLLISFIKKAPKPNPLEWMRSHFTEFSMVVFLAIYWFVSVNGKLNLGVRHVLPTFPFIYILVSSLLVSFVAKSKESIRKFLIVLVSGLVAWYVASSVTCFPYYLSYFNEIGGGYEGGYEYVVDSNYDWGQDLKRLKNFAEKNDIEKIWLDYFGGGNPEYYLGEKYVEMKPQYAYASGWVAVSINQLQGGSGDPAPGYDQPTGYYKWLSEQTPVGRAGTSIFIYYLE